MREISGGRRRMEEDGRMPLSTGFSKQVCPLKLEGGGRWRLEGGGWREMEAGGWREMEDENGGGRRIGQWRRRKGRKSFF
jgi:hypothetical protein